jgi:hypothetical protein
MLSGAYLKLTHQNKVVWLIGTRVLFKGYLSVRSRLVVAADFAHE